MECITELEVLRGRGMCLNSMCLVCNQEPETGCHALISCSKLTFKPIFGSLSAAI